MRPLPASIVIVLQPFSDLFTRPTWKHACVLLAGTILAQGPRTVTAALRVMGLAQERRFERYRRVLNRACWSNVRGAQILLGLLLAMRPADWPVVTVSTRPWSGARGRASRRRRCIATRCARARARSSPAWVCSGSAWRCWCPCPGANGRGRCRSSPAWPARPRPTPRRVGAIARHLLRLPGPGAAHPLGRGQLQRLNVRAADDPNFRRAPRSLARSTGSDGLNWQKSRPMKVAIIHDWLVTYAGAERVLEQMLVCFPDADLFSLVDFIPCGNRSFILDKPVKTSFVQGLPGARTKYRSYLPLMPIAIEQFDLSGYDLVISSSYAVAKGVLVGPDQLHICMCYSPMRYAWDLQHQYLQESNLEHGIKSWLARWLLHKIRLWDSRTANGVDHFIAISYFIASRIEKTYRRFSTVIYPPVDVSGFSFSRNKEDFYLTASRMVPYKKIPLIIEAFSSMPAKQLVVIGEGPEFDKCKALAGENVILMGWQPFEVLKDHMQRAKAFIFAAEEDFGITPLEAQACGAPVIAFGKGGVMETVRGLDSDHPTGVFFNEQTSDAIVSAVEIFEKECKLINPSACRENALRFSPERFRAEFVDLIDREWARFRETRFSLVAGHGSVKRDTGSPGSAN